MAILVATLIDQAKAVADKRNDASIPDADWLNYVNWAMRSLYRKITSLDPNSYFAQYDFTLVGGAAGASFALTGTTLTFRAMHGLDLNPDTPQRRTIQRRNFQERNRGRIGWWVPTAWCLNRKYDLRGLTLVITPYEMAAGNYRLYYRHAPHEFTAVNDATALDAQLEPYSEWIAIMAARTGLGIEETEQGPQSGRLAELNQEIEAEYEMDDDAPAVIGDVEDDTDNAAGWY